MVGGELVTPVEEFKYLRVLLMSDVRMEHDMDRQFGVQCLL